MRIRLLIVVMALAGIALAQDGATKDEKEPAKPKGVIHLKMVKDPPEVTAAQPCNNFSFAAALAAVLGHENAEIKQDYWVDKLYAGGVCLDEIGNMDDLARKIAGEYVLDDGRRVEVSLEYFPGVPVNVSSLLVPILNDETLMVFVDGHADVLVGAMWDEYLSKRGERMIDLKELHLLDPLQNKKVILDAAGDDIAKMTGFARVKAVEVNQQYWPK